LGGPCLLGEGRQANEAGFSSIFAPVLRACLTLALLAAASLVLQAQRDQGRLIQVSGVVMTSDSLVAVPFVNVYNYNSGKGAVTNYQGFFTLIAQPGDSIRFSCVGFKPKVYFLGENLKGTRYTIIQLLTTDTVHLDATVIYPWPSRAEFKEAFLALELPTDHLDRARQNLERQHMRDMGLSMMPDGNEATDFFFRQEARKYYWAGQTPPIQLFNVFAWQEFIQAWKRGDFKKQ
jgi:signal peptidase I